MQWVLIIVMIGPLGFLGYLFLSPMMQAGSQNQDTGELAPMVDGAQLMQMTVYSAKYSPNHFTVKAGIPVRWEITSSGQPGCASGQLIARGLINPLYLNPDQGEITVAEFTPQNTGTYKFSCSMNMVRGTIEVI